MRGRFKSEFSDLGSFRFQPMQQAVFRHDRLMSFCIGGTNVNVRRPCDARYEIQHEAPFTRASVKIRSTLKSGTNSRNSGARSPNLAGICGHQVRNHAHGTYAQH